MKNSGKLLWGFILSVTVIIIIGVITMKIGYKPRELSSDSSTWEYSYDDINEIVFSGAFEIDFEQADSSTLELIIPENSEHLFDVVENNGKLSVSFKSVNDLQVYAKVTAPSLEKIILEGVNDISLSNIDLDNLSIFSEGVVDVYCNNGQVDNLFLEGDGIANFYLENLKAVNCNIDFEGMGKSEVYVDGGDLSGKIEGMMSVDYYGIVSDFSLSIDGMGSIRNRSN